MSIYQMNEECVDKAMDGFLPRDCVLKDALMTGYDNFDSLLGGFRPGSFYIIGARPGMGKSLFTFNLMNNFSVEQEIPSAFISLEKTADVIIRRILCTMSMVEYRGIFYREFNRNERDCLRESAEILKKAPIVIDDTFYMDIQSVINQIQHLKKKYNAKIVFIDDLQILTEWRISHIGGDPLDGFFQRIKEVALESDVAVVILSDVSRKLEKRKDKHPRLYDFELPYEAFSLADGIITLYRDDYYNSESEDRDLMQIDILKSNYGGSALVDLLLVGDCLVPGAEIID